MLIAKSVTCYNIDSNATNRRQVVILSATDTDASIVKYLMGNDTIPMTLSESINNFITSYPIYAYHTPTKGELPKTVAFKPSLEI